MALELVGKHEVAEILGVSRQRVDQLADRADFPRPLAALRAGRIWRRDSIERWQRKTGDRPPGRPRTKKGRGKR